jgi:hypothetical protein
MAFVPSRRPIVPNRGYRLLAAVVLTAALSGCALIDQERQDQQQRDVTAARQSCADSGHVAGTQDFDRCVDEQETLTAEQRQRTAPPADLPVYGQPSPTAQNPRFCVPSAVLQNQTC